jgi:cellobiose-specific phosphotransferase system component IIA
MAPPVVETIRRLGLEHYHRMTLEQMRAHLARAESELESAHRFLDPRTAEEAEMGVVRAVANARTSVGDTLETIRSILGES